MEAQREYALLLRVHHAWQLPFPQPHIAWCATCFTSSSGTPCMDPRRTSLPQVKDATRHPLTVSWQPELQTAAWPWRRNEMLSWARLPSPAWTGLWYRQRRELPIHTLSTNDRGTRSTKRQQSVQGNLQNYLDLPTYGTSEHHAYEPKYLISLNNHLTRGMVKH